MADLIVVIPGIGGSRLATDDGPLWDGSLFGMAKIVSRWGRQFDDLRLADPYQMPGADGVRPTGLINGIQTIPGFWSYASYRPLSQRLERRFGKANVIEFPYDWRYGNAVTARLLDRRIRSELSRRPRGTSVVLVAHSMGGLVARRYLGCHGGTEHCRLLITLGTPYRGAGKAVDVLVNGIGAIPAGIEERLLRLLRGLPSVHELLPQYSCIVRGDKTRVGLADQLPDEINDTGLFHDACAFHSETAEAIGRARIVDALAIVGQRQRTTTLLNENGFRPVRHEPWVGVDLATERSDPVHSVGDSTVPRGSAQPPEWGTRVAAAHAVTGRHVNLAQSKRAFGAIEAAIEGREYATLGGEEGGYSLDVPDVASDNESIDVEVVHDDDDSLDLELSLFDVAARSEVPAPAVANLGGGRYRATVNSLEPGTYLVKVTGQADGAPRQVSEILNVFPREEAQTA